MIVLRNRIFSEAGKSVSKFLKDNSAVIGALGLAGTGANIAINEKRSKNEKRFQKEQVEATNKLIKLLESDKEDRVMKKKRWTLSKNKKLIKKSQKAYVRDKYLPESLESIKNIVKYDQV